MVHFFAFGIMYQEKSGNPDPNFRCHRADVWNPGCVFQLKPSSAIFASIFFFLFQDLFKISNLAPDVQNQRNANLTHWQKGVR
jgi:hypothetical protein